MGVEKYTDARIRKLIEGLLEVYYLADPDTWNSDHRVIAGQAEDFLAETAPSGKAGE